MRGCIPLPRRSLTWIRFFRQFPGRGAPRSRFARFCLDGTGAESRVARRAGARSITSGGGRMRRSCIDWRGNISRRSSLRFKPRPALACRSMTLQEVTRITALRSRSTSSAGSSTPDPKRPSSRSRIVCVTNRAVPCHPSQQGRRHRAPGLGCRSWSERHDDPRTSHRHGCRRGCVAVSLPIGESTAAILRSSAEHGADHQKNDAT